MQYINVPDNSPVVFATRTDKLLHMMGLEEARRDGKCLPRNGRKEKHMKLHQSDGRPSNARHERTRQGAIGHYEPNEMPSPPRRCTAIIGSMTKALAAQSLLAEAAIRVNVTKVSSSATHNGCAYGVDFPCTQTANVQTVLGRGGLRVKQYVEYND